ncbi:hypothetical protein GXP67_33280 [Rhodocytophaga rosea]|uniref:Uncharacterized protein n=1 Tax=Rhodocytophaga rosea TaxID=2704465 RepID=A0A6C0GSQ1_9BACT|nr:hypothetical protein [Rhodocytophaga rosea]QHT71181.1 hypothetical protein GXP67_33280 [Rhodocytophaga rosea]
MNTELLNALESYYNTQNQHWNDFTLKMICEVLTEKSFEHPELPLLLFSRSIDIFSEHYQSPIKAVWMFNNEIEEKSLTTGQKIFALHWVCKYLRISEFDYDLMPVYRLLKSQESKLKAELKPEKSLVSNIQDILKEQVHKELEKLPDTLKDLEPVQRLNVLCKLMPYVMPKTEIQH